MANETEENPKKWRVWGRIHRLWAVSPQETRDEVSVFVNGERKVLVENVTAELANEADVLFNVAILPAELAEDEAAYLTLEVTEIDDASTAEKFASAFSLEVAPIEGVEAALDPSNIVSALGNDETRLGWFSLDFRDDGDEVVTSVGMARGARGFRRLDTNEVVYIRDSESARNGGFARGPGSVLPLTLLFWADEGTYYNMEIQFEFDRLDA